MIMIIIIVIIIIMIIMSTMIIEGSCVALMSVNLDTPGTPQLLLPRL